MAQNRPPSTLMSMFGATHSLVKMMMTICTTNLFQQWQQCTVIQTTGEAVSNASYRVKLISSRQHELCDEYLLEHRQSLLHRRQRINGTFLPSPQSHIHITTVYTVNKSHN